jgi:hypothetical protein
MGSIISQIDTYIRDWFDYGLISKCPNCNSRTILSYPTTVCTKCKTRFRNDIVATKVYSQYYGHCSKITVKQYGQDFPERGSPTTKFIGGLRPPENLLQ